MASYDQYCPVAHATEILSERWTVLIVRELLHGEHRFTELERGLPGISRSLLARRLDALRRQGVVERLEDDAGKVLGYWLTDRGRALESVVDVIGQWGAMWALDGEPTPAELDPKVLLWFMHRRIVVDLLPAGRTVIRFDFRGIRTPFWLVLERPKPSVCVTNPGYDEDLVIDADLRRFYRVWFGHEELGPAMAAGAITIHGPSALIRQLPGWLRFSHFAPTVRGIANPVAGMDTAVTTTAHAHEPAT